MSSKVRTIHTVSEDNFEITPTKLVNVIDSGRGTLRRSVARRDVAKFFSNPRAGEYGGDNNRRIKTSYDRAYAEYLGAPEGHSVKFEIFINSDKHFNIGCMEFDRDTTAIIRRWAKSYAKTLAAKSSTKKTKKKSSTKAA